MSDIDDLSQRIIGALDRIGLGVDALEQAAPEQDTADLETLQQALEDEKQVTAQLEERVRKLKADHAAEIAALQTTAVFTGVDAEQLKVLDAELQRLRKVNQQLRDSNAALREANEAGVGEPHLINSAMLAELEALRASRAADVAEATAIMDQLVPLLDRARQQSDGEGA